MSDSPKIPQVNVSRAEQGFTLIEIAVAVAILGIALISLIGLHTNMLTVFTSERERLEASLAAQYLLTQIEIAGAPPEVAERLSKLDEVLREVGYFDDDLLSSFEEKSKTWDFKQSVTSQDLPLIKDALRRIDLSISWGPSTDEEFSLVYFAYNPNAVPVKDAASGSAGTAGEDGSRSSQGTGKVDE